VSALEADHALLLAAVREAGPVAMRFFRNGVRHWEKNPDDPVSEADHAVNDLLKVRLHDARPDYGWLSEETPDDPARLGRPRVWCVDPIDGTKAFLKGDPEFTICAALLEDGRPVAAAVYNPASDEFFEATAGGGTRLNGAAIRASGATSMERAHLLAGRRMFERAGLSGPPPGASFRFINSVAYRLSLVAAGRFDSCVSLNGKSDWDLAAADLIVTEAGGKVTTARGAPFTYNAASTRHGSVVASAPGLHAEVLAMLARIQPPHGASW
jgi:myo-inositol-1(or 4)-monophosphatase